MVAELMSRFLRPSLQLAVFGVALNEVLIFASQDIFLQCCPVYLVSRLRKAFGKNIHGAVSREARVIPRWQW
ncbi:unnamed protein product [Acanthoscelides obtectus]|uniref:Uncharacterized protein n=1 Tax=Acanthoscelides obtectus TaxID=200917 RepID=A0A9P0MAN8_ACAOB|nr:unnamed protein product [Acanthoscelides obtectus]CAK1621635.1 hypothetical protein AOBTE_LOCUS1054 [Acanthoscelides obtectus]